MTEREGRRWQRALVTGASSGLGRTYALHLAAQGTHLILVARDQRRLNEVAEECRRDHGVDVEVLAADLADDEQAKRVEKRLSATPRVDLLINNAGIGTFGTFRSLPLDGELRQLDLNVRALVRLAHAAVKFMSEHGSGTVLNVSSIMALQPSPGSAIYAATKAFVTNFSEALHEEARGTGVSVTAVMPGVIRTEFMRNAGDPHRLDSLPSFAWLTSDNVVETSLRAAHNGKAISVPGLLYRLTAAFIGVTPPGVLRRFAGVSARRLEARSRPQKN
jgi:short-subunit dehydrogenase